MLHWELDPVVSQKSIFGKSLLATFSLNPLWRPLLVIVVEHLEWRKELQDEEKKKKKKKKNRNFLTAIQFKRPRTVADEPHPPSGAGPPTSYCRPRAAAPGHDRGGDGVREPAPGAGVNGLSVADAAGQRRVGARLPGQQRRYQMVRAERLRHARG